MPKQQRLVEVDLDAVKRELAAVGITRPYQLARRAGLDPMLVYRVWRGQTPPTNTFLLGLVRVGLDLERVKAVG
jgi:transcriptional regulator with XRE-family HTH domain